MATQSSDFTIHKKNNKKISMLTAYDFPGAQLADACGVDIILVGDSVGANVLGYADSTFVTMDDMVHHVKAVKRGAKDTFVIADMPIHSIDNTELAIANATTFANLGCHAVKMEGGQEIIPQLQAVVAKGIPVCAHIGFTPQSSGSPHVVGKTIEEAKILIADALLLEKAGAFMIVLELMPEDLALEITSKLTMPTIGIGAGRFCDGQVQVFHDIMGLSPQIFRHTKPYANTRAVFTKAISQYNAEVHAAEFPTESNASHLPQHVAIQLQEWLKKNS